MNCTSLKGKQATNRVLMQVVKWVILFDADLWGWGHVGVGEAWADLGGLWPVLSGREFVSLEEGSF